MPNTVQILTKLWLFYFLATIAGLGFLMFSLLYFPVLFLSKIFPRLVGVHDHILQRTVRLLLRLQPWLRHSAHVELPRAGGGLLLVSNHRSHLDVFLLLSRISGIRILAKSSLFRIPFLSLMMRTSRQIRVERGRLDAWVKAMDEVRQRLRLGETVHIFPEMTRCSPGFHGLQPFTAGPFLAAIQEDATVVPMVVRNTDGVWPKGHAGLRFRVPVELRTLEPLRAREFASADALKNEVRRRIEQALI